MDSNFVLAALRYVQNLRFHLLTVALFLWPCSAPLAGQSTCDLRGTVVNAVTQEAVADALVDIVTEKQRTNQKGRFEFRHQCGPFHPISIYAGKPGFLGSLYIVEAASEIEEVKLSLIPEAKLTGHVVTPAGEPIGGMRITLYQHMLRDGRANWGIAKTVNTNSAGAYEIGGLSSGPYVLSTNVRGSRQHFRLAYSGTFFPGTPKFAGAAIIKLTAGQNEVADFKLDEKPMYPVSPVLETDAAKLGVVVYRLHNGYGSPFLDMREFEVPGPCSGRFCLPDGFYRLTVDSYDSVAWDKARALDPRKQPDQLFGYSNFTVSRGLVADLNIHLLHESETPLTPVHIERQSTGLNVPQPGKPLTHAVCCKGCDLAANAIGLFSADDFSADRGVAFRAADGTFAVQRLPPGRYWLHAVPICGYVARATSGGADLSSSPFVVGPEEHTLPIEITLRDGDATIRVERSWPKPMPRVGGKMESMSVYAVPQCKTTEALRPREEC